MTADTVVAVAPAKVNLTLRVLERGWGGYHEIRSVMQAIDWYEQVELSVVETPGITVTMQGMDVPPPLMTNTAYQAGLLMWAAAAARGLSVPGVHITVQKRVPWGAGLGGGSADAAAVLVGMDRLLDVRLSPKRLGLIGEKVGSDVPMCLFGGAAQASGTGNLLDPLPSLTGACLVVAMPRDHSVSTREAYARLDAVAGRCVTVPPDGDAVTRCAEAMRAGDPAAVAASMTNDFEAVSGSPAADELVRVFRDTGALGYGMTGSGAAWVGLFTDRNAARRCETQLAPLAARVRVCMPVETGAQVLQN